MVHDEYSVKLVFLKGSARLAFEFTSEARPMLPAVGQTVTANDASSIASDDLVGTVSKVDMTISQSIAGLDYVYEIHLT